MLIVIRITYRHSCILTQRNSILKLQKPFALDDNMPTVSTLCLLLHLHTLLKWDFSTIFSLVRSLLNCVTSQYKYWIVFWWTILNSKCWQHLKEAAVHNSHAYCGTIFSFNIKRSNTLYFMYWVLIIESKYPCMLLYCSQHTMVSWSSFFSRRERTEKKLGEHGR